MRLAIQPVQPSRPPPAYHREDSATTTTQPLSGGVQFVDATGGKVIDLDSRGSVGAAGALHRTFRRRPQRRAVTASSSSMNRQQSLVYHDAVLQDPRIRKQIAELKQYQPVFIILICMVFTLYMIYPLVLNNGFSPISSNIFYGASRINVIRAGAKFMPCMRQMSADEFAYFSVTYGPPTPRQATNTAVADARRMRNGAGTGLGNRGYNSIVGCPSGYTGSYVNGTVGLCTFYDWLDSVCGMGTWTATVRHLGMPHARTLMPVALGRPSACRRVWRQHSKPVVAVLYAAGAAGGHHLPGRHDPALRLDWHTCGAYAPAGRRLRDGGSGELTSRAESLSWSQERELGFLRVSLIWLIAGVLGVAFALIMSPMTGACMHGWLHRGPVSCSPPLTRSSESGELHAEQRRRAPLARSTASWRFCTWTSSRTGPCWYAPFRPSAPKPLHALTRALLACWAALYVRPDTAVGKLFLPHVHVSLCNGHRPPPLH